MNRKFSLSKPLVRDSIKRVFQEHDQAISDSLLHELVEALMKNNVFVSATSDGPELSTAKRRKTFVRSNYPLVMPVQYAIDSSGHTAVYVSILQMLQTMFSNTDILEKIQENKPSPSGMYTTHEDGTYFKENPLLSESGELKLSLILYVDDVELANPLGTARNILEEIQVQSACHSASSAMQNTYALLSRMACSLKLLASVSEALYCVWQRIIWLPMVLQALSRVSKETIPDIQASSVAFIQVDTLPQVAKNFIETKTSSQSIYSAPKDSISGTEFARGMFVSVGETGGLPKFSRIDHILLDMAAQNLLLHVHISTDIVRKMTLPSRPESVDELKTKIKAKFQLDFDFSLSYEDPDFDGQLCSFVDIDELPQKAVLKVIPCESDGSSVASDETIILPHAMTPQRLVHKKKAARTEKVAESLDKLLSAYDLQEQVDVHGRRAVVLCALPHLCEDESKFLKMWDCKLCSAAFDQRAHFLEHYRLRHSNLSTASPLPCLYDHCICTFQSVNALKIHLTRPHSNTVLLSESQEGCVAFICLKCGFKEPFNEKALLSHLRSHLKKHEMIECPFRNGQYRTNIYSSFNAHRCRSHPNGDITDFKNEVVHTNTDGQSVPTDMESDEGDTLQSTPMYNPPESRDDNGALQAQLRNNLASLFLFYVSEMAIQNIVENLSHVFSLSKPLVRDSIKRVFQEHDQAISDSLLHELVEALMKNNVFVSATSDGPELSTAKHRKTFVRIYYPLVMPVQYAIDSSGHTAVYVSILQILQTMFSNTDILEKIQQNKPSPSGMYTTHEDGTYFKENPILSESGELKLSLILCVDDVELANPLGTARNIVEEIQVQSACHSASSAMQST
ncbi:unnamed protein product [Menidia menidia]|uniref:(Atlantic silverside) hypothetical protein n=1 Tax=Menidia menidia TaxID=238744 RepID=A0A8S4B7Y2_9TELE|nr:unnamed protein product [Menidia menidia]